jgi:hypothetical protein
VRADDRPVALTTKVSILAGCPNGARPAEWRPSWMARCPVPVDVVAHVAKLTATPADAESFWSSIREERGLTTTWSDTHPADRG